MIIEQDTKYSNRVKTHHFSFNTMYSYARMYVLALEQEEKDELFETLNYGIGLIDSEPLMYMYLFSYGKMHRAKLDLAFSHMGKDFMKQKEYAIIDYGCGQGLASIVLHDYLKEVGLENRVKRIVLIEPSELVLKRAALHASVAFSDAEIITINKSLNDVLADEITNKNLFTFHLFSNVLDIFDVSITHLVDTLNAVGKVNDIAICVSPYYGDWICDNRMNWLCENVNGEILYDYVKPKGLYGEINDNWSCNIRVLQMN